MYMRLAELEATDHEEEPEIEEAEVEHEHTAALELQGHAGDTTDKSVGATSLPQTEDPGDAATEPDTIEASSQATLLIREEHQLAKPAAPDVERPEIESARLEESASSAAPSIHVHEAHDRPDVATSDDKEQEGGRTSKQQKLKVRRKLPGSVRMRQANRNFISRVGLGGTVESGERVPKKTAVEDIFKDRREGATAEGEKAADGDDDVLDGGAAVGENEWKRA